jgi:hypothetical protein
MCLNPAETLTDTAPGWAPLVYLFSESSYSQEGGFRQLAGPDAFSTISGIPLSAQTFIHWLDLANAEGRMPVLDAKNAAKIPWVEIYREMGSGQRGMAGYHVPSTFSFNEYLDLVLPREIGNYSGRDSLEELIADVDQTGFQKTEIESCISQEISIGDWGECFAYHQIETFLKIAIPWPPLWDKRNSRSSLSGADIIGLADGQTSMHFVFGEVKTSSEDRCPPTVVTKPKEGLVDQLRKLHRFEIVIELIAWLLRKSKGQSWENDFKTALCSFIKDSYAYSIIGVLVRDTEPSKDDLDYALKALSDGIQRLDLYAFYIPTEIDTCLARFNKGGDKSVAS